MRKRRMRKLKLTKDRLDKVANLFEEIENSKITDKTIKYAISTFPKNKDREGVHIKAVLINALYKTAIMKIPNMANHIFNKRLIIDKKLKDGDITVIEDIRKGHGIGGDGEADGDRDFYCFATKYAHFHNPQAFPICDNRVIKLLTIANNKGGSFHNKFSQKDLRDYKTYKSVIDSLAKKLKLCGKRWRYKKIDQGLWLWAKCLYDPKLIKPSSILREFKSIITK